MFPAGFQIRYTSQLVVYSCPPEADLFPNDYSAVTKIAMRVIVVLSVIFLAAAAGCSFVGLQVFASALSVLTVATVAVLFFVVALDNIAKLLQSEISEDDQYTVIKIAIRVSRAVGGIFMAAAMGCSIIEFQVLVSAFTTTSFVACFFGFVLDKFVFQSEVFEEVEGSRRGIEQVYA